MYEAKVKVEREIWVQNIDFLRFLDHIHNLIVLYSRVLQSFTNISSTLYTYTGGVRETWQACWTTAPCPQDLIQGTFYAGATSKLVNKITPGLDLG